MTVDVLWQYVTAYERKLDSCSLIDNKAFIEKTIFFVPSAHRALNVGASNLGQDRIIYPHTNQSVFLNTFVLDLLAFNLDNTRSLNKAAGTIDLQLSRPSG